MLWVFNICQYIVVIYMQMDSIQSSGKEINIELLKQLSLN